MLNTVMLTWTQRHAGQHVTKASGGCTAATQLELGAERIHPAGKVEFSTSTSVCLHGARDSMALSGGSGPVACRMSCDTQTSASECVWLKLSGKMSQRQGDPAQACPDEQSRRHAHGTGVPHALGFRVTDALPRFCLYNSYVPPSDMIIWSFPPNLELRVSMSRCETATPAAE